MLGRRAPDWRVTGPRPGGSWYLHSRDHTALARLNKHGEADAYERFLPTELFPAMRKIPGFQGADVLRREEDDEVGFVTLTRFETLDDIRAFAGDEFETPVWNRRPVRSCRVMGREPSTTPPHRSRLESPSRCSSGGHRLLCDAARTGEVPLS